MALALLTTATLLGSLAIEAGSILAILAYIPIQIAEFILIVLGYIYDVVSAVLQSPRSVFLFIGAAVLIFVLGPIARDNTSAVIETINIGQDCVGRPVYETIDKVVMQNVDSSSQSAWPLTALFWNRGLRHIWPNLQMAWADVSTIVDCIVVNENIFNVLQIPNAIWTNAVVPNFYAWVTQPLFNKQEFYPIGQYGYYFPFDNTVETDATYGTGRFEFPNTYGPGQGPAVPPGSRSPLEFPFRDFYVQLAGVVARLGNLLFEMVGDLSQPGQKFFPKFIISDEAENSYWREISDATCSGVEFVLFTFAWPVDPNGVQTQRNYFVQYTCPTIRFVGQILRFLSLVINDLLTVNRPYPLGVVCEPPSSAGAYLLQLFQGVIIIDFFIALTVSMPASTNNINLFSSNAVWCEMSAFSIQQSNDPTHPNGVPYLPGLLNLAIPQCTGITRGSFIPGCTLWDGTSVPTRLVRIDYFAEFLAPFETLAIQFATPPSGINMDTLRKIQGTFQIIDDSFNVLILDLIYVIDTISCSSIVQEVAPIIWGSVFMFDWFEEIIEFIYYPYTCQQVFPGDPGNLFLCLVGAASESGNSFFQTICNVAVGIDAALITLKCAPPFRKRGTTASEHFAQKSYRTELTTYESVKLYTSYLAFYGRETWHKAEQCREVIECDSQCALAPCMPTLMDCVQTQLSKDNPWRSLLDKTSDNGFYVRNSLTLLAVTSDVVVGCPDGAVNVFFSAYAHLVELMRDFAVRYLIVSHHHVPTFQRCMKEAHEGARLGVKFDEITRNYLRCIGIVPDADVPEGKAWSETLEKYGVRRKNTNSECASILHENGFLFDSMENATQNVEHTLYKICMFNLAFGASAIVDNSTSMALEDFLDLRLAPFAMMQSTNLVNAKNYPELANQLLLDAPEAMQRALPFEFNERAANVTLTQRAPSSVELLHPYMSIGYAFFQYMADLYEKAIIVESDGEEKDRIDRELFKKVVVAAAGSSTFGATAAKRYTEEKRRTAAGVLETRVAHYNGTRVPSKPNKKINDFTVFSKSFYWVDDLETIVNPRSTKVTAQLQTSQNRFSSEPLIESFIDVRNRLDRGFPNIIFGMRIIDNAGSSVAFSYLNSVNESLTVLDQEYFKMGDLRNVAAALAHYSTIQNEPIDLRQRASQAVVEYNIANNLLKSKSIFDNVSKNLPKSSVIKGFRALISVAWGLLDNRIQFKSLPPYQAIHAGMDAMTSGDSNALTAYLDGERGYVPSVGYVSIESYNRYMRMANEQRKLFLGGYGQEASEKDDYRIYLFSARRNAQKRVESLKPAGPRSLEGSSQFQRWVEKRRASLLIIDHTHRARFLLDNRVLHHDNMMHHAAGPKWIHYERALEVSESPLERLELALITAAPGTTLYYQQIGDTIFSWLGFGPSFITDLSNNITNFINDIGTFLYTGDFSTLSTFATNFLNSYLCQGPEDYEYNGTGKYRLGCIPFADERMFKWITFFPTLNSGPNPLYTFVGPGPIQWPASMYAPGGTCQNPRNPAQCPLTPTSIWTPEFSTYFQRLCITNACYDPSVDTSTEYPLCVLGCDHCTQTYLSAIDFGYVTGWDTLVGYDILARTIYDSMFSTYDAFFFVVVGFLFLAAIDVFFFFSVWLTIVALLFAAWGELFVTLRVDRILSVLFLYGLYLIAPGAGWFLFILYVVTLFGPVFYIVPVPASALTDFVNFIRNTFLPGPIIIFVLKIVNWGLNLLSYIFSGLKANVTSNNAIIAQFEAAQTVVADFPNSFYTIMSSYNIVQLGIYLVPYILLAVVAAVISVIVLLGLFEMCGACCGCCNALWNCCQAFRIRALQDEVDEDRADADSRLSSLEDRDVLSTTPAPPPTAISNSIGINIDAFDEKPVQARRRKTESAKTK